MHYFIVEKKLLNNFLFNKQQIIQIKNVLKIAINSELICIYNKHFYRCKLIEEDNTLKASILFKTDINNEKQNKNILFVANTIKDKIEFIIQKATELGIYEINIVNMLRSKFKINKNKINHKIQRWHSIALEATEQSHRNYIPGISYFDNINNIDFQKYIKYNKIILEPKSKQVLSSNEILNKNCLFFIGPEGGFDDKELLFLEKYEFNKYNLGKRILRMETACVSILSITNYIQGE